MGKIKDITGQRFGRLVALEPLGIRKRGDSGILCWRFLCDCGNTCVKPGYKARTGHTSSCGCILEGNRHGMSRTPEWMSWYSMKQRCFNPKHIAYSRYGGRGITVCDEWAGPHSFVQFVKDMGPRPEGTTLDRIDNNLGYSPENCRWATKAVQSQNQRPRKPRGVAERKSKADRALEAHIARRWS